MGAALDGGVTGNGERIAGNRTSKWEGEPNVNPDPRVHEHPQPQRKRIPRSPSKTEEVKRRYQKKTHLIRHRSSTLIRRLRSVWGLIRPPIDSWALFFIVS